MIMPAHNRAPSTSKKFLYGFIIDDIIYLEQVVIGPRSPAWKNEFDELVEAYEPEASFVISESGVLKFQEELESLSEETYGLVKDLIGLVVIEGLTDETLDLVLGTGDYKDLEDVEVEEIEEEEELED
jgi:hypothetical protein